MGGPCQWCSARIQYDVEQDTIVSLIREFRSWTLEKDVFYDILVEGYEGQGKKEV